MKHAKKKKKMMYKKGGKLKPVDSGKNPGLAKLPKDVRNNMGFMMYGGKMKKAPGGMKMRKDMMNYAGGGKMLNGMSMQKAEKGMKMPKAGHGMAMQGGAAYRQLD